MGNFIYDYQTLIAGALAIGAAYYGATPVWRQLRDSNLQTQILRRETLAARLREAEERKARVAKAIDSHLWQAQEATSTPDGEPTELNEHDAHGLEQSLSGQLDWFLVALKDTEESNIERAKAELKKALDSLMETLSDVYWPAANDRHGEDYSLTDEEWAQVLHRAATGRTAAADKVGRAWKANRDLKDAQDTNIEYLRRQIAALDLSISKGA